MFAATGWVWGMVNGVWGIQACMDMRVWPMDIDIDIELRHEDYGQRTGGP